MYKDYLAMTLHDNDFNRDLESASYLLSHMITYECILDNGCINLIQIRDFLIDIMIRSYELRTFGKYNYDDIEKIKDYFEKHLKVYELYKEDIVADNSEILYLCINEKMREYGEYFII